MNKHQDMVRAFHQKFGVPCLDRPGVPSDERVRLRLRLIAEEFVELLASCADPYTPSYEFDRLEKAIEGIINGGPLYVVLPEFVDALGDLEYVILGSACEVGVDLDPVFAEIHRSNMAKEGGGQRKDGKITKPPGWVPPDIAGELDRQCKQADYDDLLRTAKAEFAAIPPEQQAAHRFEQAISFVHGNLALSGIHISPERLREIAEEMRAKGEL